MTQTPFLPLVSRDAVATAIDDPEFRAQHVGASEVAALFGESPWLTEYELFHRKIGNVAAPDLSDNQRIFWGLRLESAIVEGACELYGYRPLETPHRLTNGKGFGGHPDRIVLSPDRNGKGILEIKTVDWLIFKRWQDEPPLHYLLQSQAYQGLAGAEWGDVIVLVGGNELHRFQYEFRPALFEEMERRVEAFWQSVKDNKPPKPDYTRDLDTLSALYDDPADTIIDLSRDNRAYELCAEWLAAKAEEKAATARVDAAKAELLDKLGNNGTGLLEGYRVSAPLVKASEGTLVTESMVGSYVGARKAYRRFAVKDLNA